MVKSNRNSHRYLMFVLGFLAAFAPLVTDMYLPGLPAMTKFFGTTVSMVQLGITASMIGLAAGQLFVGPVSDKYGRRRPLIASIAIFIISTIFCIFAWDIESFIAFRFVQGAAGAGGIVLSRSISADLFHGRALAKFFAMIAAVNGLAPICAPVMGGVILSFTDWRGIFVTLLALGIVLLFLCIQLKETLAGERRSTVPVLSTFKQFAPVLHNTKFMRYTVLMSFAMAVMFAYIASSPFIFQGHYHLSPLVYSVYFATNAVALAIGSFLSSSFRTPQKAIHTSVIGLCAMSFVFAAALHFEFPFFCAALPLFLMLICAGLIFPTASALAIDCERRNTGTASAVLGAMNFIFGGIVTPLVGIGNIMHSTGIAMIVCAVVSLALAFRSRRADLAEAAEA
jgi:MFS transporter, DHA1 family, multidrug resistance protein